MSCVPSSARGTTTERGSLMRFGRSILTATTLVAATSAASAQDWHGFYLGVNAGYAWGSTDVTTSTVYDLVGYFAPTSVDAINAVGKASFSPTSFTGGATAGWNISKGKVLLGIEADWSYINLKSMRSVITDYPCCSPANFLLSQEVTWSGFATARVRLGIAKPTMLSYLTGGAAFASTNMAEDFADTYDNATQYGSHSADAHRLDRRCGRRKGRCRDREWSVKLEYLYADLGTMTFRAASCTTRRPGAREPVHEHESKLTMSVDPDRAQLPLQVTTT